jgi:hypothetical protein
MFIWWGRRLRTRRLETGHFDCPHCRSHQPWVLVQLERVLMLYSFIPIAGGEEVARYIECQSCRTHQDAALFAAPSGEGLSYERRGSARNATTRTLTHFTNVDVADSRWRESGMLLMLGG